MSSGQRPYYMAEPCPQCGQEDVEGKWLGARMGATAWGHSFSCCSEKCGLAYRDSRKRFERERAIARQRRAAVDAEIERLSEKIGAIDSGKATP